MTMTTHDLQVQRYIQPYDGRECVSDTSDDVLSSEISELCREIEVLTEEIAEGLSRIAAIGEAAQF